MSRDATVYGVYSDTQRGLRRYDNKGCRGATLHGVYSDTRRGLSVYTPASDAEIPGSTIEHSHRSSKEKI